MSGQWGAIFAVRRDMDDATVRVIEGSEDEPFESVTDIADICATFRVSANVFLRGSRVGWIDELGRAHFQADNGAAMLTLVNKAWPKRDRIMRVPDTRTFEVWCEVIRKSGRIHSVCVGEVRVAS